MAGGPPEELVRGLVSGPAIVSRVDWHDVADSTNDLAAEAARQGAPEGHLVLADYQTAGRGRRGRAWRAAPGTSLLLSLVLRPAVPPDRLPLLALLAGLSVAEAASPHVPGARLACKWPNDLLARGGHGGPWRKAAGVLVDVPDAAGAVVVGVGVNVDWRGVERPSGLEDATSLAELAGPVDRWRLFAAFAGVFGNRYRTWVVDTGAFLADYRRRCATLGADVRVVDPAGGVLVGQAVDVDERGALQVRGSDGRMQLVVAGDVAHVR